MPIIEPPNPLEGSAIKKIVLPDGIVHQIKDSRIPGVDNAPTSGSDNVVTSGGTYTAIQNAIGSVYRVKGSKATYANLPSSGNVTGDVWNVEAAYGDYPPGTNWVWTGTAWDALGGTVDLSAYQTTTTADSKYVTALGASGNNLTWTKNGTTNNITVPFATNATTATKLGNTTVGSTSKPIYLNSGTPTQVSSLDGSLVGGYIGYSQDGFLVTHPEAAKGVIVPYLYNDIAFLMSQGGSCSVYSTTDTDLTADTLTVKTDWNSLSIKENLFDASPSYYSPSTAYAQEMNADGLIIDLELPRLFTYGNRFYIDFGNSSFGFENIDILVKNSNTETNYVSKVSGGSTNNKSEYFVYLSHSSSSGGSTVSGFNRLRIHLYGRSYTAGVRIAQIGLIQFNSIGHRYPMMSRGFDDGVWRNISPATTNTYSLGNANSRWTNIYSNFGSFGSTANGASEINISSSTNNIRLLAYTGNTAYIQSGSASNNAGNLTLCGRNGVAGGTLVFNFTSTVVSGPFSVREGFSVGTSSNNKNATIYGNAIANSFVKSGGTSSQFLKADGSVDSTVYATNAAFVENEQIVSAALDDIQDRLEDIEDGSALGDIVYEGDNLGTETYTDSGSVVTDLSGYATKAWVEAKGYLTTETDPSVYPWAKAATKPTYTASEVGALPDTTDIPSKLSDLTNDMGYITGYTETDPVFSASAAAGITSANIAAWNSTPKFYTGTSDPSSSLGNDGDIYLKISS